MKRISFLFEKWLTACITSVSMLVSVSAFSQISVVCTDPSTYIYGLTGNGEIYPININNARTGAVVKNSTYPVRGASSANGIGYNTFNGRFYYFKRNVTSSPQEFVSFNPTLNLVTTLANSTCTVDIHTGCVSYNGTGYYTIDVQGSLHYYNILANTWTLITNRIVDQFGNNVTNVIRTQTAGDMAVDGWGNIWFLTSSSSNYGLYEIPAPMPTTPVVQLNVTRVIAPTSTTPTGNSFAGIAFSPNGQIYMSTKNDNRLYVLRNRTSLDFIGTFDRSDVGNDLTSCSFPFAVLPVLWKSFAVGVQNSNTVVLNWEVAEEANKGFYVQHSQNGSDWEDIGFVASKGGHGEISSYSYSYMCRVPGKQYYRIRQVDPDNKESYSETRSVMIDNGKEGISVWPNPAIDQVRIVNTGGISNLHKAQLYDLAGKLIMEKKLQTYTNTLSIGDLPAGTYMVRVLATDGSAFIQKIIKQ